MVGNAENNVFYINIIEEEKGIMACVIKCQIEVLKRMLRNI